MKFWKGNKIDAEFELPVSEVASQFMAYVHSEPGGHELDGMPVERLLRWWLTSSEHLDSVWVDETGPESFEALFDLVLNAIHG